MQNTFPDSHFSKAHFPQIAGVIAEYNPFHNGHLHHLQQTRQAGADFIVVVMSTCFTQRGEMAVLPVKERVQMALEGGADAVFALPVAWSLRDAEHFALGGVSLLNGLGCSMLSFGCETPCADLLSQTASLLESPPESMLDDLHTFLAEGLPYPAALARAAGRFDPACSSVLSSPNNTLAVCYLRQLMRLGSSMVPLCIPRESDYLETRLDASTFASASGIRAALARGDWPALSGAMPETDVRLLREASLNGRILKPGALDHAVLCMLRTLSPEFWKQLPDQSEGLPDRVRNALKTAVCLEDLLDKACTRRYTRPRVARLVMHAFLQFDRSVLPSDGPSQALLLGVRRESEELLHLLGPMKINGNAYQLSDSWRQSEEKAWDLWSVGCGLPMGGLYSHRIVRV